MTTYRVEFEVEVPEGVDVRDLEAFMRFWLGENSSYFPPPLGGLLTTKCLDDLPVRNVDVRRA
jgi:hypothetical protein